MIAALKAEGLSSPALWARSSLARAAELETNDLTPGHAFPAAPCRSLEPGVLEPEPPLHLIPLPTQTCELAGQVSPADQERVIWHSKAGKLVTHRRDRQILSKAASTEVVDWGRSGPIDMITLNALRVLRAAGRLG